jgi:hypothetical protein
MNNIAAPAGTEGQVVDSVLRYKLFMEATLREPTQAEVDALMVQTNAFYLGTFMGSYDNVVDFQADGKEGPPYSLDIVPILFQTSLCCLG